MAPNRPLYFTIWRWHFYAGLFCIPFLLLLSVTGAIYVFRVEFEEWRYRDLLHVPASESARLPHAQIAASARHAIPGKQIVSYVPAFFPGDSAKIEVGGGAGHDHAGGDSSVVVFVNPHTGAVLGSQVSDDRFMERVKRLHGRLLAGTTGVVLVELASGWMFVLIVSGLYLWFPRANWSVWGTFLPRLRAGKRILLRDLHAVGAAYLAFGLCFQILSGQPWTLFASKAIVKLSDGGPGGPNVAQAARFHSQPPASPAGSAQDWVGGLAVANAGHVHSSEAHSSPALSMDETVAIAEAQRILPPYQISMPSGPTGVYSVRTLSGNPRDTVYLHLDQYSGTVLARLPFVELKPQAQAVAMGIAIHEGTMFGWPNQVAALLAAIGSFLIAALGTALWWSRRPQGRLGGPPPREGVSLPRGAVWITCGLGVVFPLVGISMLLMWVTDRILRKSVVVMRRT